MTTTLIIATLVASLTGNAHCGGMCGPFAAVSAGHSGPDHKNRSPFFRSLSAVSIYNAGRLITYLIFGVLAGLFGWLVNQTGESVGLQHTAILFAGCFMLLSGTIGMLRLKGWVRSAEDSVSWLLPVLKRGIGFARTYRGYRRALLLGAVTSLLPCGWLYLFVIAASATQDTLSAVIVMFAFWVGTLPVLTAIGIGSGWFLERFKSKLNWVAPVTMIVIGLLTLTLRGPIDPILSSDSGIHGNCEAIVSEANSVELPCCCTSDSSGQASERPAK